MDAKKQVVLYFDWELSDKQFEKRYSEDYNNHFQFDDNFLRININPECTDFDDFETKLFEAIEEAILMYDAKILIIDNLTYLKTQSTESAKEALPLMKRLKEIKLKHNLSILALAHLPKRSQYNPITVNDLAGSKHLANFTDSIFAIGASNSDKRLRYIKQIKARATEIIYDTDNVIICEITKPCNFLGFELIEFGNEYDHLKTQNSGDAKELDNAILELKQSQPNLNMSQIAKQLGTYKVKVSRVFEKNGIS